MGHQQSVGDTNLSAAGDQHSPTAGNDGKSEQGPLFGKEGEVAGDVTDRAAIGQRTRRRIIRLLMRIRRFGRVSQ